MGLFFCHKLANIIYLETSSLQRENVPKLPGVLRWLLQKTGNWPVHDIKGFAIGTFLNSLLVKEQVIISFKKNNLCETIHCPLTGRYLKPCVTGTVQMTYWRNQAKLWETDLTADNGWFQKISIPYHGRLLGFPKGRGGSRLWNSEGMGVFTIGNPKAWGNSTGGISGVESVEWVPWKRYCCGLL